MRLPTEPAIYGPDATWTVLVKECSLEEALHAFLQSGALLETLTFNPNELPRRRNVEIGWLRPDHEGEYDGDSVFVCRADRYPEDDWVPCWFLDNHSLPIAEAKTGLEWSQEEPNGVKVLDPDGWARRPGSDDPLKGTALSRPEPKFSDTKMAAWEYQVRAQLSTATHEQEVPASIDAVMEGLWEKASA